MRVRVVYQGILRETLGRREETVELREGATLRDLLDLCQRSAPILADYRSIMALSVNYEYARLDRPLREGDEVALLPPVAGGAPPAATTRRCAIVRSAIDPAAALQEIKHPADGAVSVFDGIVRDHTRGRRTLYLDYEAYEEMALRQMERLCQEAITTFPIREARIVHRIGRLRIGETSVFIAVASAHRAAAMDACRFLIDALKRTVPIWKKEYFEDGAVWADGEPFPEDIRAGGETASKS
jgi:molybdopterin synthase catalytic subunit/molybdopterin converting factor small subunit